MFARTMFLGYTHPISGQLLSLGKCVCLYLTVGVYVCLCVRMCCCSHAIFLSSTLGSVSNKNKLFLFSCEITSISGGKGENGCVLTALTRPAECLDL